MDMHTDPLMTRLGATELKQLSPLSDPQVVERILDGDVGAFELLMRRYNQRLFIAARSVLERDADAEDALQETYLRAFQSLRGFEGRSAISTWLTRIAINEALRLRERNTRLGRLHGSDHALQAAVTGNSKMFAATTRNEDQGRLEEALATLNDNERTIVMLRLIHGLSTHEVAECTQLSESNVKVILHRTRIKLANTLTKNSCDQLRHELSFDGARCDRIVERVFASLPRSTSSKSEHRQ
ncbi:MAG: sigma-70 family RNA polymerase sigma factor [Phycisphaerales bacterium JB052]